MNKKEKMYARIKKHGEDLNRIFNTGRDPVELCKALRMLEREAYALALDYCNGTGGIDSENWEEKYTPILDKLDRILHYRKKGIPILMNGDARGYALKIRDDYAYGLQIYRDMGGYGIIAPDLSE